MKKSFKYSVGVWCVCASLFGCGKDDDDTTLIILDMGPGDMAMPVDMAPPEFDFVYTIPDVPIIDECDPESEDLPDRFGIDLNCDGIDGDESRSLFVASYGDDTNDGSKYMPLLTIQKAIDMAAIDPTKDWVLVQEGRYLEVLEVADGVSIAGGYELGWRRNGNGFSQVTGGNPTVRASNVLSTTYIMNLEVRPTEQLAEDRFSVVTMSVEQSPGIILERMFILGGTGRRGLDGTKGDNGLDGARGSNGGRGREDSSGLLCSENSQPTPGSGGTSSCGAGGGGRGGAPEKGDRTGKAGQAGDSVGSATGGASGSGGGPKRNGENAEDGEAGMTGGPGRGAGSAAGSFTGYEWQGEFGFSGELGTGGAGGGGGGGGGGGEDGCDSWGGAGAGGGAGGCAGEGGQGGGPGGASVALMLLGSDIVIRTSRIVMGQGGAGGDGGAGGFGGEGGEGGQGGSREDDSGTGGPGGAGGKGGTGGPGGGGAGGPSFGIYSDIPLTVKPAETNYVEGAAGFGGNGAGPDGRGATGMMLPIVMGDM